MTSFPAQWQYIQSAIKQNRLPQGLLCVGPLHCNLPEFALEVAQLLLCSKGQTQACGTCNDCLMVARLEHADLQWIKPEKIAGSVKIDQIREVQNTVFLTPQRASYKVIVVESACRMNTAAANALLKILEEPASHTVFILLAQQLSTVLPTVLSRCHLLRFSLANSSYQHNLLTIGEHYPQDSQQAQILQDAPSILDGLQALVQGKQHPSVLTAQWIKHELPTCLWFLYLVFAQIQQMNFRGDALSGIAANQLQKLAALIPPKVVFSQIDAINALLRKLGHNIPINPSLALENLLFALTAESMEAL